MDKVSFYALGGLDENGKNLFVLEINEDIFIVECGIKYPDSTMPGIDLVIPKFDYLIKNKNRVKAIIITHGHDDVMGALPYLYKELQAPVYLTAQTKNIVSLYTQKRKINVKYNFAVVNPSDDLMISGHKFRLFQTCHSIANSFGFAVETDKGNVVYTGDFILNFANEGAFNFDLKKLIEIAKKPTLLLLSESHGADKEGCTAPKHRCSYFIEKAFEDATGRIFISLYTQNFYNIQEVIALVKQKGKILCFADENLGKWYLESCENSNYQLSSEQLCSPNELQMYNENKLVILICGSGEKIFSYMKSLAKGDFKSKGLILKETDTFVNASPAVPGTEKLATASFDDIYRTGAKVVTISRKDVYSMHAHQEDLRFMLKLLEPKYYVPVTGEYVNLMANAKMALATDKIRYTHRNIFIIENGMKVNIDENGKAIYDFNSMGEIEVGDLLVDGKGLSEKESPTLMERTQMATDGVIILGATVDSSDHSVVTTTDVQMRGFVFLKDSEKIVKSIICIFNEEINSYKEDKKESITTLQKKISDKIGRIVKREIDRNPVILPCIIDINKSK